MSVWPPASSPPTSLFKLTDASASDAPAAVAHIDDGSAAVLQEDQLCLW